MGRNPEFQVNHVAADGATASYQYSPERGVWLVSVAGSVEGYELSRDAAKELAERLILAHDEGHLNRAFEYVKWATQAWPGMDKEGIVDTIMKHCPDACRQAVLQVLKHGTFD